MKRLFIIILAALAVASASAQQPAPLRLVKSIPLPGVKGRIDHFSIDPVGQRLFMSALGNNTVEVLDLRTNRRLRSITGLDEPQGVSYVPDSHKIFVANGGDGSVRIFDGNTYQQVGTVHFPSDADDTRYDASTRRVYVGYGEGGIGALNAMTGKLLGEIKVKGHPEAFEVEYGGRRIYINIPTAHEIVVADWNSRSIVDRWQLNDFQENFPMGRDPINHRLFVATRWPPQVLVFNTTSGKRIAHLSAAGDADDLWYDSKRQRIYVTGGDGNITVIEQRGADRYNVLASIPTAPGARTSFYSPELNRLYVAVPHRDRQAAELRIYSAEAE